MTAQQTIAQVPEQRTQQRFPLSPNVGCDLTWIGGRYDLTKAFYMTGKADVWRFDVRFDSHRQASAGSAVRSPRRIYSEIGFA